MFGNWLTSQHCGTRNRKFNSANNKARNSTLHTQPIPATCLPHIYLTAAFPFLSPSSKIPFPTGYAIRTMHESTTILAICPVYHSLKRFHYPNNTLLFFWENAHPKLYDRRLKKSLRMTLEEWTITVMSNYRPDSKPKTSNVKRYPTFQQTLQFPCSGWI
jgi:hypothetical protein